MISAVLTIQPDPDQIVLWKDEPALQEAAVSEKLSESQQEQLQSLLEEYHDVLRGTPGGLTWQSMSLTQGLQGAPATFQRMMDRLITGMVGVLCRVLGRPSGIQ